MPAWSIAVFYACLAGSVTFLSWRTPAGLVGLVLLLSSLASGIGYFAADFGTQLLIEAICEAVIVWHADQAFRSGVKWSSRWIMALAVLDVAVVALSTLYVGRHGETRWVRYAFGTATNAVFFLQCVGVAAPGVKDAYLAWIRSIDAHRRLDSAHPDHDWLIGRIDDQ